MRSKLNAGYCVKASLAIGPPRAIRNSARLKNQGGTGGSNPARSSAESDEICMRSRTNARGDHRRSGVALSQAMAFQGISRGLSRPPSGTFRTETLRVEVGGEATLKLLLVGR